LVLFAVLEIWKVNRWRMGGWEGGMRVLWNKMSALTTTTK
jgi:hypothetical protein